MEKFTFGYRFEKAAQINADSPAVIYGDKEFTWREYNERSNQLARALLDLGVKRDERVAIMTYNRPEYLEAEFATFKTATPLVNLNYRFYEKELMHVLKDSCATSIILHEDFTDIIGRIRPDLKEVKNYIVIGEKEKTPEDMLNYEELIAKYPKSKPELDWEELREDDVGWHFYTGGTTGLPKGVMFTQEHLLLNLFESLAGTVGDGLILNDISRAPKSMFQSIGSLLPVPWVGTILGEIMDMNAVRKLIRSPSVGRLVPPLLKLFAVNKNMISADLVPETLQRTIGRNLKMLIPTPLMHAVAYIVAVHIPALGGSMVMMTKKHYDPHEMCELIEKKKVNSMIAVGDATYKPMAEALDSKHYDVSSMFLIVNAGAPLSAGTKKRILAHMPHALLADGLSSTENVLISTKISTAADKEIESGLFKINPLIQVFNESNELVKPGEVGLIGITGEHISTEYYKDAKKSADTYRTIGGKHWVFAGDMATVDEEGYIHLVGRGSECINTGGEKVYPGEVEDLIKDHPKVMYVGVTGVPHERWGEAVTAVIQLKEGESATEDELRDYCRGKIADYKIPKNVLLVDELPLTAAGKAYYVKVRELAKERIIGS